MGFLKKKLSLDLRKAIDKKLYKTYKVIIKCNNLLNMVEKILKTSKSTSIILINSLDCICAEVNPKTIERLIELPAVKFIAFDDTLLLCSAKGVLSSNKSSAAENSLPLGKGVTIGIIDSGIYPHPDLLKPSNKINGFVDILKDVKYPYDDNGHGTFLSGIICGSGYCGKGMYKGVALGSEIFMVKAFNSIGRGNASDILYSIEIITSLALERNIKVLLLPFELLSHNDFLIELFDKSFKNCISKGIVVVVPSGNNDNKENSMKGIAILDSCITVGGVDTTLSIQPYINSSGGFSGVSNKRFKPDVSASALNICSLNSDKNYVSERDLIKLYPRKLETPYTILNGTSCSAAYISALCAIILEKNPDLTPIDINSILKLNASSFGLQRHLVGAGTLTLEKIIELKILPKNKPKK